MKSFKKVVAVISAFILLMGGVACDNTTDSSIDSESVSSSSEVITPVKDPLYQIEDVVKENLMWNTEEIFAIVPEIKLMPEIKLAKGIQAFKFQSAPYKNKEKTWVFGAMGTPSGEIPESGYPAVVLIHGGGGYVFRDWMLYWMRKGFVAIAIDMFGNELNEDLQKVTNPDGGPKENDGSNFDSVENETQSWVYHSVYNVMMANNLLRGREDVDSNRIVATGISWGGYITNIVAGVDKRFSAFAPVYGSGFVYEDTFWTERQGTFGGAVNREKWIELYDPSSYLPYATKPMLFVSGVNDNCFATVNRAKSARLVKGQTFYSQRSDLTHGNFWTHTYEIYAFFRHVLYGENSLTQIGDILVSNGVAILQTENDLFHTVNFLYTLSTDVDSHKWEWRTVPVTNIDGEYSYVIPAGATAYLFETVGDSNSKDKDKYFRQSTAIYLTENQ